MVRAPASSWGVSSSAAKELTSVVLLEFLKSQGAIEEVKGLVRMLLLPLRQPLDLPVLGGRGDARILDLSW